MLEIASLDQLKGKDGWKAIKTYLHEILDKDPSVE